MLEMDFIKPIKALDAERVPFCIATIVDGRGSIPQIVGAKAIFTRAGLHHGTVGGGRIEANVAETARALLDSGDGPTQFMRWNLQRDLGMTCGGEVAVFFEIFGPRTDWSILVFGAGHISQKLCRFLAELDCRVTCVDTRAEWLDRFGDATRVETRLVEDYVDGIEDMTEGAYVIVMTKGHETDQPILEALSRSNITPAYLGVIGSNSKARLLARDLRAAGVAPDFIDRMTCPIGDKVGNNTPAEISFGIVSQILQHRREMTADPRT